MTASSVLYEVSHRTTYRYSIPVSISHHVMHLTPRPCSHQVCHRTALIVLPTPTQHTNGIDFFGNPLTHITLQHQHKELILHARSVIEVHTTPAYDAAGSTPWDRIYPALFHDTSDPALEAIQYAFETPKTRATKAIRSYALECFPPGRPVLAGVRELTRRIHREFRFDPTATTVSTPVEHVFEAKRGVCQDFAHLQIACLRALRIPARYVSGYLLTRPPPGKPRLIGADASHAWVSVYAPGTADDWVDFDPTNNLLPDTEHITLALGRDFSDISPLRGIILGGGSAEPEVAVTVVPLDEEEIPEALLAATEADKAAD